MDPLQSYRKQIDEIDQKILSLFAKRNMLAKKIGAGKKKQHIPIIDKKREEEKMALLQKEGQKQNIDKDFVQVVWGAIFKASYRMQNE